MGHRGQAEVKMIPWCGQQAASSTDVAPSRTENRGFEPWIFHARGRHFSQRGWFIARSVTRGPILCVWVGLLQVIDVDLPCPAMPDQVKCEHPLALGYQKTDNGYHLYFPVGFRAIVRGADVRHRQWSERRGYYAETIKPDRVVIPLANDKTVLAHANRYQLAKLATRCNTGDPPADAITPARHRRGEVYSSAHA